MSKEKAPTPEATFIVGRKVDGQYEVVKVHRKGSERTEEVLKRTEDRRIAADRLSLAFQELFR